MTITLQQIAELRELRCQLIESKHYRINEYRISCLQTLIRRSADCLPVLLDAATECLELRAYIKDADWELNECRKGKDAEWMREWNRERDSWRERAVTAEARLEAMTGEAADRKAQKELDDARDPWRMI